MVVTDLTRWLQRALTVCVFLFFGTVAGVFLLGLVLPPQFEVQRSLKLDTSRERLHPFISDLRSWEDWTAWSDRELVHEYSEPSAGVGAWHVWRESDAGAGRIEITAAGVEEGVWYDMTFDRDTEPMRGAFRYLPSENGVQIEWSLRGQLGGPLERALGPIYSWRIGADFDASLKLLGDLACADD